MGREREKQHCCDVHAQTKRRLFYGNVHKNLACLLVQLLTAQTSSDATGNRVEVSYSLIFC